MGRTKDNDKTKGDKEQRKRARAKKPQPKDPDELDLELREVFDKFDADSSGTVSVAELRHMLQLLGQNPTEAEVKAMVNRYDDNRNGQLDFDEFKELITTNLKDQEAREDELRSAFAVFDKDDSGFIDKQELAKILRSTGEKLEKAEIDKVFNTIDTNGDGKIDYEEFVAAMEGTDLVG